MCVSRARRVPAGWPRLVGDVRALAGQGWEPWVLGDTHPPALIGRRRVFLAGISEEVALGLPCRVSGTGVASAGRAGRGFRVDGTAVANVRRPSAARGRVGRARRGWGCV